MITDKVRPFFILLCVLILSTGLSISQAPVNPCLELQNFKIVVLGSSTAAGAGVLHPDSAWVNRYRNYLQSINPDNEVINLAVGGFSSYKVMPTGFIPPAGRPTPDVTHNITYALGFSPDAIIVNLPSNDVSASYSLAEQNFNLDSIYNLSLANNVPMWITTTQPKNMPASFRQLQAQMRDSIFAHFGAFAIDFWTTLAMPDNSMDPIYDAGDGTHLNDAAHAILLDRVIEAEIPEFLFEPSSQPDYAIVKILSDHDICGNPNTTLEAVVTNSGPDYFTDATVFFEFQNLNNPNVFVQYVMIQNGLNTCIPDTVQFVLNTSESGQYETYFHVSNQNDTNSLNDFKAIVFEIMGIPDFELVHDTLCNPGSAILKVNHPSGDEAFWYDLPVGGNLIGAGETFDPGFVDSTLWRYAEVVRGETFYRNQLFTTSVSSTNFNGTMFDLVASEALSVDSFDMKIADSGWQTVEAYFKVGSYKGYEQDASAWTMHGSALVFVSKPHDFTRVAMGGLEIAGGDTVGIYLKMATSTSRLSYQNVLAEIQRSTAELKIITGTGIGHNWLGSFFPRDWNGRIYYHYGFKPQGDCATGRQPIFAYLSESELDLGLDTLLDISNNITLTAPGFSSWNWSDGSSDENLQILASDYGYGVHEFSVVATDSFNCVKADTILVTIDLLVSLSELEADSPFRIYPNPSKGWIYVEAENLLSILIFDALGNEIFASTKSGNLDLTGFSTGIYFIQVNLSDATYYRKIVLE